MIDIECFIMIITLFLISSKLFRPRDYHWLIIRMTFYVEDPWHLVVMVMVMIDGDDDGDDDGDGDDDDLYSSKFKIVEAYQAKWCPKQGLSCLP